MSGEALPRAAREPSAPRPSLAHSLVTAAKVAVIGSMLLAVAECGAALIVTARHFHVEAWLARLVLAVIGKNFVTHLLLWTPLLLALGAAQWLWARRRNGAPDESALLAAFVALAGLVVGPADLELAGADGWRHVAGVMVGVSLLALAIRAGLHALDRRLGRARFCRVVDVATGCCAAAAVAVTVVFVRSPLFNPGTFRSTAPVMLPAGRGRPNVLWIVLDTARPDRMSVYGHERPTTPFLEQWASQSIVFDRSTSNGTWTVPSHAAMFTGLSLRQHGSDFPHPWLDGSFVTVAEALRDAGYRTVAFSNNPWVAPDTNLTQGFEDAYVVYHLRHLTKLSLEYLTQKWGLTPPLPWLDPDLGAAMTNQMVGDWLRHSVDDGRPLFLFINYMDAHLPYAVPRSYRAMFMTPQQLDRSYDLRQRAHGGIVDAMTLRYNIDGPDFLSRDDREVLKLQYDAALRYLDDRVAELIGGAEKAGSLGNSLLIVCSDHGEHLDTHGMWAHQYQTYNDLVRTALIVREPGRDRALRVTTPVQLSDLYQTVLKVTLGTAPMQPAFGSRDLLELAAGPPDPHRVVISEYGHPEPTARARAVKRADATALHRLVSQIAAQDAGYKYVASSDTQHELFDLGADPGEMRDLVSTEPETAERLSAVIADWLERVPPHQSSDGKKPAGLDSDLVEALRSLGYVGD